MGSFIGHVVPGSFFTLFSIWWLYNVFYKYFYSKRFPQHYVYRNSSSFPCASKKYNNFPLESFLKVFAVILGMIGEFATGFEEGHFTHIGNAQHMTMFFFFGLNGLIDIGYWRGLPLPPKLDYATALFAFSVEGFLFYNHLHGRSHMDIQVHMFLFYTILLCTFCTGLEVMYPKAVLPAICRCGFTLLQGTWFFQIGFILYPPWGFGAWNQDDHGQIMLATLIYTWHFACLFGLVSAFGVWVYWRVGRLEANDGANGGLMMMSNGPRYTMINTNDDDEDDDDDGEMKVKIMGNGHVKQKIQKKHGLSNGNVHKNNHHTTTNNIIGLDSESEEA